MLGCYAPVAPASILGLWGVIKSPRSSVQRSAFDLDDAIVPARLEDLAVENTDGYHVKKRPNQPQNGPNSLLFMVAKPRPEDALSLSVISPYLMAEAPAAPSSFLPRSPPGAVTAAASRPSRGSTRKLSHNDGRANGALLDLLPQQRSVRATARPQRAQRSSGP